MCLFRQPKLPDAPEQIIPNATGAEAQRQADIEATLRRRRAGAAANVLTSPTGIPATGATSKLGAPGQ